MDGKKNNQGPLFPTFSSLGKELGPIRRFDISTDNQNTDLNNRQNKPKIDLNKSLNPFMDPELFTASTPIQP